MAFPPSSLLLTCWLGAVAHASDTIELYIPEAPPLTFEQHHSGYGIAGDMALAALKDAGVPVTVVNAPWARAQYKVAGGKNRLITPLSRTPERENQYTWIAPIMLLERAFFSLTPPVHNFAQAHSRYQRIAVGLGTPQEQTLLKGGIDPQQIVTIKLGDNPINMLKRGRVDAWFASIPEARYLWPKDAAQLYKGPVLNTSEIYLACSQDCDAQLVERLKHSIEKMHSSGLLETIRQTYLPDD